MIIAVFIATMLIGIGIGLPIAMALLLCAVCTALALSLIHIFLLVKAQVFDILHHLGKARRNGEAAPVRDGAVKHIEIAYAVGQTGLEIAVSHGQLIKIAEHGQICLCFHL